MGRGWWLPALFGLTLACGGSTSGGAADAGLGVGGTGNTGGGGAATGGAPGAGGTPSGGAPGTGGAPGGGGAPGTGGGGSGACTAPAPGQVDGDYLLTLSFVLDPTKPIVFAAKLSTANVAGKTGMQWVLQALSWSDRLTKVGDPIAVPGPPPPMMLGADGSFGAKLQPLVIPGQASPFSHTDLGVDLILNGFVCAGSGFFCGTLAGDVTQPISLPLNGSTWTLEKASPGGYPEPPHINCQKQLAAPVGSWQ